MDYTSLSKTISHALRHEPEKYGLTLTKEGWADIEDLLLGIKHQNTAFKDITQQDIEKALSSSDKKRHEIQGSYIRALYGHSAPVESQHPPAQPPHALFHGTTAETGLTIQQEGIKRMGRQFVHLSSKRKDAINVAQRRKAPIIILEIDAKAAFEDGIIFYNTDNIWLCDYVPAKYIKSLEESP